MSKIFFSTYICHIVRIHLAKIPLLAVHLLQKSNGRLTSSSCQTKFPYTGIICVTGSSHLLLPRTMLLCLMFTNFSKQTLLECFLDSDQSLL